MRGFVRLLLVTLILASAISLPTPSAHSAPAAPPPHPTRQDFLAIGVPDEYIGAVQQAGAVNVIRSPDFDLFSAANDEFLDQEKPGAAEDADPQDHFGAALAVMRYPLFFIFLPLTTR